MTFNCPHCGAELNGDTTPGNSVDCPNCGKRFIVPDVSRDERRTTNPQKCPSCGNSVEPTAQFCSRCGSPISPSGHSVRPNKTQSIAQTKATGRKRFSFSIRELIGVILLMILLYKVGDYVSQQRTIRAMQQGMEEALGIDPLSSYERQQINARVEKQVEKQKRKAEEKARKEHEALIRKRESFLKSSSDARSVAEHILGSMIDIPGKNYKIGKMEVTQMEWETIMGENPSHFKGSDNPVETVSWNDCQDFLELLNSIPVVKKSGLTFRFPMVDQWEFACRAGSAGAYCSLADGTEITEETMDRVAWFKDNSDDKTHPVGQKEPNAFGLYDMMGNVQEWIVSSEYEPMVRGGCYWFGPIRPGRTVIYPGPTHRNEALGFRLCAEKK